MGEAGDEAVMPLARDSSGSLGVKTIGNENTQSGKVDIEINITNEGNEKLQASKAEANFDETGKLVCNIVMSALQTNQYGMRRAVQHIAKNG